MITHFQEFTLGSGIKVTAEYSYSAGSETSYSPMHGASGGDPCEVSILKVMPNIRLFDWLCRLYLRDGIFSALAAKLLRLLEWWYFPGTDERERMEALIAEHVTIEPPDYEDDYR